MNWWTRFCDRHRGSISIFLSAILLPFLWLIGIFIDDTNFNLSVASVEGAGELTANAALANYDTVLADVYGLFAMSQSSEDQANALEHYFADSLDASNLMASPDMSSGTMDAATDSVMASLDLVRTEELKRNFIDVDYSNFTVDGLEGSSLANPEILKSQIVEFMKYRGPAEVGMSLLDSLGVFKKIGQQAEVLQSKVKTDQKVADLAEESQRLYRAIVYLDKAIQTYLNSKSSFYGSSVAQIQQHLQQADTIIETQLVQVANVDDLPKIEQKEEQTTPEGQPYHIYQVKGVSKKDLDEDYTLEDLRIDLNQCLTQYESDVNRLASTAAVVGSLSGTELDQAFQSYRTFGTDMEELYALTITLMHEGDMDQPEDAPEGAPLQGDAAVVQDAWLLLERTWEEVVLPFQQKAASYDSELDTAREQVGQYVRSAITLLAAYKESAQMLVSAEKEPEGFDYFIQIFDELNSALDHTLAQIQEVRSAMTAVEHANTTLSNTVNRYEQKANADDFSLEIKGEVEKNDATFSPQDLDELERQVNAIKTYLGNESSGEIGRLHQEFTLYGQSMLSISLSGNNIALGKEMVELYRAYGRSPGYRLVTSEHPMTSNSFIKVIGSGSITLDNGQTVTTPPYYVYMDCNYQEDGTKKNDQNLDKSAQNINDMAQEETDTDNASEGSGTSGPLAADPGVFVDSPSGSMGGTVSASFGKLGSGNTAILGQLATMLTLVVDLTQGIDDFLENGRDNLLVTQYVDSNFSCATSHTQEQPMSTLTNVAVSAENNPLLGCEMEYIIYGDKGTEAKKFFFITLSEAPGPIINVSYAKNNILAIRFACNAIFAISNQQINNMTLSPALAIQAATSGIFPYKVAQVVLDVCLAYAESLSDLSRLMNGEKVELIKTYSSWTIKPDSLISDTVKELTSTAIQELSSHAQQGVSTTIQNLIDNSAEKLKGDVDAVKRDIQGEIEDSISAGINSCMETIQSLVTNRLESMFVEGIQRGTAWTSEQIRSELTGTVENYLSTLENDTIRALAEEALSSILDQLLDSSSGLLSTINTHAADKAQQFTELINKEIREGLDSIADLALDRTSELTNSIRDEINGAIDETTEQLKTATEEKTAELTQQLSEKISGTINGKLDEYFPSNKQTISSSTSGDMSSKNSGVGEIFKFSYQDYLQIFLFLELNKDSDAVMLRIADVIQVNAGQGLKAYGAEKLGLDGATAAHPVGNSFRMTDAYTYVQIDADIQLNPLLLSKRLFSFNGADGLGRWAYHYETIKGY